MGQGAHIKIFRLMSNSMSSLGHVRMVSFCFQLPNAVVAVTRMKPCKGAATLNAQAEVGDIPGIALEQ